MNGGSTQKLTELSRQFFETNAGAPITGTSTHNTMTMTYQRNEYHYGVAYAHTTLDGQRPDQKARDIASAKMMSLLTSIGENWNGINMMRVMRAHKAYGEYKWAVETKGEEDQCRMCMFLTCKAATNAGVREVFKFRPIVPKEQTDRTIVLDFRHKPPASVDMIKEYMNTMLKIPIINVWRPCFMPNKDHLAQFLQSRNIKALCSTLQVRNSMHKGDGLDFGPMHEAANDDGKAVHGCCVIPTTPYDVNAMVCNHCCIVGHRASNCPEPNRNACCMCLGAANIATILNGQKKTQHHAWWKCPWLRIPGKVKCHRCKKDNLPHMHRPNDEVKCPQLAADVKRALNGVQDIKEQQARRANINVPAPAPNAWAVNGEAEAELLAAAEKKTRGWVKEAVQDTEQATVMHARMDAVEASVDKVTSGSQTVSGDQVKQKEIMGSLRAHLGKVETSTLTNTAKIQAIEKTQFTMQVEQMQSEALLMAMHKAKPAAAGSETRCQFLQDPKHKQDHDDVDARENQRCQTCMQAQQESKHNTQQAQEGKQRTSAEGKQANAAPPAAEATQQQQAQEGGEQAEKKQPQGAGSSGDSANAANKNARGGARVAMAVDLNSASTLGKRGRAKSGEKGAAPGKTQKTL